MIRRCLEPIFLKCMNLKAVKSLVIVLRSYISVDAVDPEEYWLCSVPTFKLPRNLRRRSHC
jgi:hypothetical protein